MNIVGRELLNAFRQVHRRPRVAIAIVILLALGAAPNAALISAMLATSQASMAPYPDSQRLILMRMHSELLGTDLGPSAVIERTLASSPLLDEVGAFQLGRALVSFEPSEDGMDASVVHADAGVLDVLGVRAIMDGVATLQNMRGVLLSSELWSTRTVGRRAGPPAVVYINGQELPVLGRLPAGFAFPERGVKVWILHPTDLLSNDLAAFTQRTLIGKAVPGANLDEIRSQLNEALKSDPGIGSLMAQIALTTKVEPLRNLWLTDGGSAIRTVMFAVAALLGASLANASALFVLSAWRRRHEMAVEACLGASPLSLRVQTVLQVSLLVTASLAVSIPATWGFLILLARLGLLPPSIDQVEAFDHGAILGNVLIALLGALVLVAAVSLAGPTIRDTSAFAAIRARAETPLDNLATHAAASLQVALGALVLYVVVLLATNIFSMGRGPFGYSTEDVHVIRLAAFVAAGDETEVQRRRSTLTQFAAFLRTMAGVDAASLTMTAPLGETVVVSKVLPFGAADAVDAQAIYVDEEYFEALRMPILSGRQFDRSEVSSSLPVAIIDRHLTDRYFGSSAVGAALTMPSIDESRRTGVVIGVVEAARHRRPDRADDYPTIFLPAEAAYRVAGVPVEAIELIVRAQPNALNRELVADALARLSPTFRIESFETLDDRIRASAQQSVHLRNALSLLALAVLVLSVAGNYAVFSFGVDARLPEYGLRKALGASETAIFLSVLRHAAIWMSAALVLCVPLAVLTGVALARDLALPILLDVPALLVAMVVSLLCALGAVIAPAWRASAYPTHDCLRTT